LANCLFKEEIESFASQLLRGLIPHYRHYAARYLSPILTINILNIIPVLDVNELNIKVIVKDLKSRNENYIKFVVINFIS